MTQDSSEGLFARFLPLAAAAGAALLSALVYGYNYGADPNLAQLLPFINKLQAPALYPADPYVSSLSSFPSLYPRLVAWLVPPQNLGLFHSAGYAATMLAFYLFLYKLAFLLFEDVKTAALACLASGLSPLGTVLSIFGDDPLLKTSFYQTALAAPVTVGVLYLFLKGRFVPALGLAGGLYWLNALPANYLAALLLAGTLALPEKKKALPGWCLFAALAGGWFAWKYSLPNHFGPASEGYVQALRGWYSGHYFPLSWPPAKWARAAVYTLLFGVFLHDGLPGSASSRQLRAFLLALGAMWLAAFAFSELLPVPLVIMAQLFRSDTLFILLGLLFAARYMAGLWRSAQGADWLAAGLILIALTELGQPSVAPFAALLLLARIFHPRLSPLIAGLSAAACLFYAAAAPVFVFKCAAAAALFGGYCALELKKTAVPSSLRLVALLLALLQFAPAAVERARTGLEYVPREERDWRSVQDWARTNTPAGAVFFTPMPLQGFRVFSQRSTVAEWLDGAAMHWAPGFERQWLARLNDVYFLCGGDGKNSALLAPARRAELFSALSRKYGADYVVELDRDPLPFPELYRAGGLAVYRIKR